MSEERENAHGMGETPEWTGNGRKGSATALQFFWVLSGLRACFLEFLEDFEGFPGSSQPPAAFDGISTALLRKPCVTSARTPATPVQPPCNHPAPPCNLRATFVHLRATFVPPSCTTVQPPCNLRASVQTSCGWRGLPKRFGFFG